jgi:hypothetical protein
VCWTDVITNYTTRPTCCCLLNSEGAGEHLDADSGAFAHWELAAGRESDPTQYSKSIDSRYPHLSLALLKSPSPNVPATLSCFLASRQLQPNIISMSGIFPAQPVDLQPPALSSQSDTRHQQNTCSRE